EKTVSERASINIYENSFSGVIRPAFSTKAPPWKKFWIALVIYQWLSFHKMDQIIEQISQDPPGTENSTSCKTFPPEVGEAPFTYNTQTLMTDLLFTLTPRILLQHPPILVHTRLLVCPATFRTSLEEPLPPVIRQPLRQSCWGRIIVRVGDQLGRR
ncbi:hypothetical protein BGW80DRAFT_1377414, partial [Lactifluus volemus]